MPGQLPGQPPALPRPMAWCAGAMVFAAALSLLYTAIMTRLLHTPHPYGVTLFWHGSAGSDFTVFAERSRLFGTPAFAAELNYPFTYPAPVAVVFALLFRMPHPLAAYLILCVTGVALWAGWLRRGLSADGTRAGAAGAFVAAVLASSWPLVLLFNTANIEGVVAILLGCGVLAVLRERWTLGATLIGLAASMKLFPFVLLALFCSRRRWKALAWSLAVAALATLGSLALLGPGILASQRQVDAGLGFIREAYILSTQRDALNYSHSLFSPVKFAVFWATRHHLAPPGEAALLHHTLQFYMAAVAVGGVALYLLRIRRLPMLNQVLALTVCAVLLPPLSADYTLLELLLPFGLLCLYAAETGARSPGLAACFGCFAALFSWETFLTVHYSFDRPMRAVALCVLLAIALRFRWPWAQLDLPSLAEPRHLRS